MLMLAAISLLAAQSARAQTQAEPPAPVASVATPRYGNQELKQAFDFIDANHDGRISREEAAGFRGVARHFDDADLDRDNVLSRAEFENAMNAGK